jgi:hypothetical protein
LHRPELLVLERLRLGVILPPPGQRVLVLPDFSGAEALLVGRVRLEEEDVGGDAGVGRKDAVGQPDDRVQVELLEQSLLDLGGNPVAEQEPIRQDDAAPAAGRFSFDMTNWKNRMAVSCVRIPSGKLLRMPRSSSPPKGGLERFTFGLRTRWILTRRASEGIDPEPSLARRVGMGRLPTQGKPL